MQKIQVYNTKTLRRLRTKTSSLTELRNVKIPFSWEVLWALPKILCIPILLWILVIYSIQLQF